MDTRPSAALSGGITKDVPRAQMKLRQQRDGGRGSASAHSGGGASVSSSHGVTFWVGGKLGPIVEAAPHGATLLFGALRGCR
jgi:hypothetical protein